MIDRLSGWLPKVVDIAISAGDAILPFYRNLCQGDITRKVDQSPVTAADQAADSVIYDGLNRLTNVLPYLSEERHHPEYSARQTWSSYWLVDPLDGTRGFINGSDEFTVNIALIDDHQPVLGVVYQPVTGDCYFAADQCGAYYLDALGIKHTLKSERPFDSALVRVLCGRSTGAAQKVRGIVSTLGAVETQVIQMNSSVKFCKLAMNAADYYIRFGPTSEWDTAAGQCIMTESGGLIVDFQGKPLQYNAKPSLLNPAFVAVRDAFSVPWVLQQIRRRT